MSCKYAATLAQTDHRPWPLPPGAWTWRQSWLDLLFAHWPLGVDELRPLIPEPLEIDTFDGQAWIGLVPFRMAGVMRRPLPDMPGVSAFPELNVRTYVTLGGKPGVWFLSLDATNRLAIWAARKFFHLPYHRAAMRLSRHDDWFAYDSQRAEGEARFVGRYRPIGTPYASKPGSLEHWLTERYCLFARKTTPGGGRVSCTEVHHIAWPLRRAACEIETNTMLAPHGLGIEGPPALLHFAERLDVVVWSPAWVA
ncbi:hypothetical protein Mal64_38240 [Pseudobythopirellula maris]|uniref:DUF2071 domain-containing protein n=1 Tax=Pseudobythopirellula maris TaxID=2527991 RepID=A0A5C5ZG39_9BACT|nr:DUF2071 domain-containing protein [Pseudobythopirellula maris]TWT86284.1 hypothetical protein Mal64_38240 [Pseudobythopirellula maris]